jgi:hypothetical protein
MGVVTGWQGRFFEDYAVGDVHRSRLEIPEARESASRLLRVRRDRRRMRRRAGVSDGEGFAA